MNSYRTYRGRRPGLDSGDIWQSAGDILVLSGGVGEAVGVGIKCIPRLKPIGTVVEGVGKGLRLLGQTLVKHGQD